MRATNTPGRARISAQQHRFRGVAGPKFRADHVGSLLRPDALARARSEHVEAGRLHGGPELREIEDREIADAIAMQEDIGLPAVTDGEFRRSFWHYDFLDGLRGFDVVHRPDARGMQFSGSMAITPKSGHRTMTASATAENRGCQAGCQFAAFAGIAASVEVSTRKT